MKFPLLYGCHETTTEQMMEPMKSNRSLTQLTPDATLNQIMDADGKAGEMLASIGLEPSSYKDETLRAVCQQRKWSEAEVLKWIKKHRSDKNEHSDTKKVHENNRQQPGDDLIEWSNYLESRFHKPVQPLLLEIKNDFPRVDKVHGNQYLWLKHMQQPFAAFEEKLGDYLEFEQKRFFPLLVKLEQQNDTALHGLIRQLQRAAEIVNEDQSQLEELINAVKNKGNGLESPPNACSTLRIMNQNFKSLFAKLRNQFEQEQDNLLPLMEKKIDRLT